MTEAVVVGAGFGGLSAAIGLAAAGLPVTVLEAGDAPGGKAGVAVVDGVEFDTGPSVLTLPEVADDLFRLAGTRLADEVVLVEPEPAFRYHYPDGVAFDVHVDPERTAASLERALGSEARADFLAFLGYASRIWEAAAPAFVYGDAPTIGTLIRRGPAALGALASVDAGRSMWRAIGRRVRSPHVQWLLARYATYNGSDPRRAPATLNCIAHVELGLGGYGVEGGVAALVRALVRSAERLGVRFRYDTPVRRLRLEGTAVAGVETAAGEVLPTRIVVGNADVAHLFGALLPPPLPREVDHAAPRSLSGWTAVARALRAPRAAHTVLFPAAYLEEFADLFDRDRPPADPTVYLCAQEVAHRRKGWPDHEPLFLMANAPPEPAHGSSDPERWRRLRERTLARAHDAGLLAREDALVWERTPTDLALRFPGTRGALYGASSNGMWSAFRRPANRVASVPGLYLASGSAHPGGGVPLCLLSGRAAARAVTRDLGIPEQRMTP